MKIIVICEGNRIDTKFKLSPLYVFKAIFYEAKLVKWKERGYRQVYYR